MCKTCAALVCYTAAVSIVTRRSSSGSANGTEREMDFVHAGARPIRYSMIIALMGQNYPEHTYNHALFTDKVKVQTKIDAGTLFSNTGCT